MRITSMTSAKGNPVPNQFIITDIPAGTFTNKKDEALGGGTLFQSYDSNIAFVCDGMIYLDEYYWNYSKTTGKYRNSFLGMNLNQTRQAIEAGEAELTNLNKKKE